VMPRPTSASEEIAAVSGRFGILGAFMQLETREARAECNRRLQSYALRTATT
jgi:hypothetical protein